MITKVEPPNNLEPPRLLKLYIPELHLPEPRIIPLPPTLAELEMGEAETKEAYREEVEEESRRAIKEDAEPEPQLGGLLWT